MSRLLYYLILKPLSLLPLPLLYVLFIPLYLMLYYVFRYRKTVVMDNLKRSFPNKSNREIEIIAKKFYHHLTDLVAESIRMFSIGEAEVKQRCVIQNPEILEPFAAEGRSAVIVAGHHNNWEMAAVGANSAVPHQLVGVYTPIKDKFLNRKMKQSREKFGLMMISKKEVKDFIAGNKDMLIATIYASDQSPASGKKAYWMSFLNQDTPVAFGAEKYAAEYDQPAIFTHITKTRRGHYSIRFTLLSDHPAQLKYGELTEKHVRLLEQDIREKPEYWLWSHKRWKRKRPNA